MQPIEQLPNEVARALAGVCFDVDDTVTRHGTLEASAYEALWALKAAGLKLMAVTGRPLGFAEVIARMWPVDAAVGENGAGFVARAGVGLRTGYFDDELTRAKQAERLAHIRARIAKDLPHVRVSSDGWARRCDLAFDVGEEEKLPAHEVAQLTAIIEAEGAQSTVSSVHAHAQYGAHDKAIGASFAAKALWALDTTTLRDGFLFVGDSGNDAAAFSWFKHSAGVANVRRFLDRLPTPPRYVATAECGAGFAEIAQVVLRKRSEAP